MNQSVEALPLVSIIIPTRNEEKNIGECLNAVLAQDTFYDFEVTVIDCRSTDRTASIVRSYQGVKLNYINPEEFGHGRTRNLGAKMSRGDILVFLVADATPSDIYWLEKLVAPFREDPEIGGVFSKQLKREGVNPSSYVPHRLDLTSGDERVVKVLADPLDFEKMTPEERYALSKFDDVSSAIRRKVWEKIPFTDRYWAEDLDWAVRALKAGYKVVYEPESQVLHSHGHTLAHSFRRAYLDQEVAKELFDYVYYFNRTELVAGYFALLKRSTKVILSADENILKRIGWMLYNPPRLLAQLMGAYFASKELLTEGEQINLFKSYRRTWKRWRDRKRILRTSFTVNNVKKNVIFANPTAMFSRRVKIPEQGRLKFSIAINPPVWELYEGDGVEFVVRAGNEVIYSRTINPASNEAHRMWFDEVVDLARFAGSRVKLRFETYSEVTDNAWAGWAEPRITSPVLTRRNRLRNRMIERAHFKSTSRPLRHP